MPFEEDERDPSVWFLDHNYVESMNEMFKKVNAREKLIGWYHSGPKLRAADLKINELFKRYTPNPLLVIIDVQPKEAGVPTDAYFAVDEIKDVRWKRAPLPPSSPRPSSSPSPLPPLPSQPARLPKQTLTVPPPRQDGTTTSKTFVHTPSIIEAEEAEEIGVEHLLRDIRGRCRRHALDARHQPAAVAAGPAPAAARHPGVPAEGADLPAAVNHAILGNLQDVFNLLPNLSTPKSAGDKADGELAYAMSVKTNDQLMAIYLSSLIRAITAFHDLIENKIQNRQQQEEKEEKEAAKKDGDTAAKDGEKKEPADKPVNGVNGEPKDGAAEKEKEAKDKKK